MQELEIELQIGETIQIGDRFFTVIDIDGNDINVRVDSYEELIETPTALPPAK